jgi:soluble lytic murein transglycosylase-like protein
MRTRALALGMVLLFCTVVNSYTFHPTDPTLRTTDLILKLKENLDPEIAAVHARYVNKWAERYNLKPELVVSVVSIESDFSNTAVSCEGAIGVMQVLPRAHKDKLKQRRITRGDLFRLDPNYDIGCQILAESLKKGKTLDKGLKFYTGGYVKGYVARVKKNLSKCRREGA